MKLEEIDQLEKDLGLESGFFEALLEEDDWSFVIKLHAMIEGATTYLLSEYMDDSRLSSLFAFLELSNARTGKVAFLRAMELINSDYKRYIVSLSELRNSLVHDVRNVNFRFSEMLSAYSPSEMKNFVKRFGLAGSGVTDLDFEVVKAIPKRFIWSGAIAVLTLIYERRRIGEYERFFKAVKLLKSDD